MAANDTPIAATVRFQEDSFTYLLNLTREAEGLTCLDLHLHSELEAERTSPRADGELQGKLGQASVGIELLHIVFYELLRLPFYDL
jgi:hypothetical protein